MGEKGTILGHVPHPPRLRREVGAAIFDHAVPERHSAGVGVLEAGENTQQRRLTAARRPQDGRKRSFRDFEVEPVEYDTSAERLSQAGDHNARHVPNPDRCPEQQKPRCEAPGPSSPGRQVRTLMVNQGIRRYSSPKPVLPMSGAKTVPTGGPGE